MRSPITVPYWTSGDEAATVLATLYELATIAEQETGLEAYDPQVEESVAAALRDRPNAGQEVFDQVADHFGRD